LRKAGIRYQAEDTVINLTNSTKTQLTVQYTGCGGLHISKDGYSILIDPFFSNQKLVRLSSSMFGGGDDGKRKLSSSREMIDVGLKSIGDAGGHGVIAVLSAHGHYDHLMDIPAVLTKLNTHPTVYLNRSGFNTCYNIIDTAKMMILENHMTTQEKERPPIELTLPDGTVNIYPILAEHNPHIKNVKFFAGSKTKPVTEFTDPFGKTRANDWLEGNTFSFLVDYLDQTGKIEFRTFIQSSSCNPPAGIPPHALRKQKDVDLAFLGVASFHFSPDYPCTLLDSLQPKEVVWIHWEDFFRKYTKDPKTVRGTDVVKFFDLPCVKPYKPKTLIPWPGVRYDIR
jgi:hypothetical protein